MFTLCECVCLCGCQYVLVYWAHVCLTDCRLFEGLCQAECCGQMSPQDPVRSQCLSHTHSYKKTKDYGSERNECHKRSVYVKCTYVSTNVCQTWMFQCLSVYVAKQKSALNTAPLWLTLRPYLNSGWMDVIGWLATVDYWMQVGVGTGGRDDDSLLGIGNS